ncbi:MAG TPA: YcnI family protein [Acidimicrobiales bacterium]
MDDTRKQRPGSGAGRLRAARGSARVVAAGAVAAAGLAAAVVAATPASAHVTPDPAEAPRGGYATVRFRVPNEESDANTTEVEINFPTDTPLASVAVEPVPGWEYRTETTQLDEPVETEAGQISEAVTRVTFTGGQIRPGEFQEFAVQLGPLPTEADTIHFPTLQTYDNGDVVRWIDPPAEDGSEPESPAPALTLVDADEAGGASDGGAADDEASASAAPAEGVASDDDVSTALTVGIVGLVVGLLGLATAVFAILTSRRRSPTGS